MNYNHEETEIKGKLFNKEVIILLLKYIFRYKGYFLLALLYMCVITAVTLYVPALSKMIIDKIIIKQGYTGSLSNAPEKQYVPFSSKVIQLGNDTVFIFKNTLSSFPPDEIRQWIDSGFLSRKKYILIESPQLSGRLETKFRKSIDNGAVLAFADSMYLMSEDVRETFTATELISLRAADINKLSEYFFIVIVLFILQFIASYLQIIALMKLSQKAMRDLRTDLFTHIISLELPFFDSNPVGRVVSRVTHDIESLNEMFSSVLVTLLQDILIMSGVIVVMFYTDVRLALIVSCTFPPLFAVIVVFRNEARKAYRVIRTKITDLNAFLNESISGIRIIQIFTNELKQFQKFNRINNDVYRANIRQVHIYAVFRPLIGLFRWVAVASLIYFGAHAILNDRISYGLVVMFVVYIGSFFEPIGDLAEKFDILQSATAAGEKILSVFKTSARKEGIEFFQQKKQSRFRGEIVFDDVWFSYVPGEWVLKGVSFCVSPRQTIAIVGETGSGKSTIINLLGNFYPVQKGEIRIDNKNINEVSLNSLRSNIATVMQDVFLFSRSVKENITLGSVYDENKFNTVINMTNSNILVEGLSRGIEQQVMERGVTFSAGERQLLAFTRALYFDPSILVLDEATSNIDTETEILIQNAISRLVQGRTSIIIAHRLSTIRHADCILVINNGKIAESGDHKSLMNLKGLYYELYRLQFEMV